MGMVHAEITLRNVVDAGICERGVIAEPEVRQIMVTALVDTGAGTLVISEKLREQLGLKIKGKRPVYYANDAREICPFTEPVEIFWKGRYTALPATVVPNCREVLLGALPLEDMDLIVDPVRQTLVGAHGDEAVTYVM